MFFFAFFFFTYSCVSLYGLNTNEPLTFDLACFWTLPERWPFVASNWRRVRDAHCS